MGCGMNKCRSDEESLRFTGLNNIFVVGRSSSKCQLMLIVLFPVSGGSAGFSAGDVHSASSGNSLRCVCHIYLIFFIFTGTTAHHHDV